MAQVSASDRYRDECLRPGTVGAVLPRLISGGEADAAAAWFAALADPTRARVLQALSLAPELCVRDLAFSLSISVSALSHQLRYLRERGIVQRRKDGRIAFYALADDHVRHVLADALAHLGEQRMATTAVS